MFYLYELNFELGHEKYELVQHCPAGSGNKSEALRTEECGPEKRSG